VTVDRTDAELVSSAIAGESEAMNELIRRHHQVVFRTALGILRDEDGAADVTQDTFLKAFAGLRGFRGDAKFRTWLLTIATNAARGALRRASRRREVALDPDDGFGAVEPDDAVPGDDGRVRRIREHLATLPEKQRLAVSLRIFDGLSFREVGALIDSSEGAARVNYHHGIRRLRGLMEEEG
jgi:RNA polymerase sigma-70 factor (ECF subfamily)